MTVGGGMELWHCKGNCLSFNFEKTHYTHFRTKNTSNSTTYMKIVNDNEFYTKRCNMMQFLGINIASTLTWRTHKEQLTSELSTPCYAIRSITPNMSHVMLIMIYYSLVHSNMTYGLIFWRNSSDSCEIFRMQKRVTGITMQHRIKKLKTLSLGHSTHFLYSYL